MYYRSVSSPAIVLFFLGVAVWSFMYGPANRTFVVPDKTITVQSLNDVDGLWKASGVHGRIAVIFATHLDLLGLGSSYPIGGYLDNALYHGVVRTAIYIVPDRFWPEIERINTMWRAMIAPFKATDTGFILIHEGGRIQIMPFSKYVPGDEKALVVIEPAIWSEQEQSRINGFIKSGQMVSDLTVIINEATATN